MENKVKWSPVSKKELPGTMFSKEQLDIMRLALVQEGITPNTTIEAIVTRVAQTALVDTAFSMVSDKV